MRLSTDSFFVLAVEHPAQPDWHRMATTKTAAYVKNQMNFAGCCLQPSSSKCCETPAVGRSTFELFEGIPYFNQLSKIYSANIFLKLKRTTCAQDFGISALVMC